MMNFPVSGEFIVWIARVRMHGCDSIELLKLNGELHFGSEPRSKPTPFRYNKMTCRTKLPHSDLKHFLLAAFISASPVFAFAIDTNHDGLDDLWCQRYGVAPFSGSENADGDARINLVESINFTDPYAVQNTDLGAVWITDVNPADGLDDHWQARYQITAAQKFQDPDGDGRKNIEESVVGTNPLVADIPWDSAGAQQTQAAAGPTSFTLSIPQTMPTYRYTLQWTTDLQTYTTAPVTNNPRWGNGLLRTDTCDTSGYPRLFFRYLVEDPDTDSDLVRDWPEIHVFGTDPNLIDSDFDGFTDGYEVRRGTNPALSEDGPLDQALARLLHVQALATVYFTLYDDPNASPDQRLTAWNSFQAAVAELEAYLLELASNTTNPGTLDTIDSVGDDLDDVDDDVDDTPSTMYLEVDWLDSGYEGEGEFKIWKQKWRWTLTDPMDPESDAQWETDGDAIIDNSGHGTGMGGWQTGTNSGTNATLEIAQMPPATGDYVEEGGGDFRTASSHWTFDPVEQPNDPPEHDGTVEGEVYFTTFKIGGNEVFMMQNRTFRGKRSGDGDQSNNLAGIFLKDSIYDDGVSPPVETSGPVSLFLASNETISSGTITISAVAATLGATANQSIKDIDIVPADGVARVVGDVIPTAKANSLIRHFVTPKESDDIPDDYVELQASGTDAATFDSKYEWEGGVAGSAANKRKVKRDTTGKTEVKLKKKAGAVLVQMNVWVVWATMSADIAGVSRITEGQLGKQSARLGNNQFIAGAAIEWTATIQPQSVITDEDIPDLETQIRKRPPGKNKGVPYLGNEDATDSEFAGWDVTRRIHLRAFKGPNLEQIGADDPDDSTHYLAPQDFPSDPVEGNDDPNVETEDDNPYDDSEPGKAAGTLMSFDLPSATYSDNQRAPFGPAGTGFDGDRLKVELTFQEFVRVQIGQKWYRCSGYMPWRHHYKLSRVSGKWTLEEEIFDLNN